MPEETPLDINSKLVVVLVNLGAKHLVTEICDLILTTDPADFGDLMLDVAEAFMDKKSHENSLPFLRKLVDSQEYGQVNAQLCKVS